jgi:hypothetical protein
LFLAKLSKINVDLRRKMIVLRFVQMMSPSGGYGQYCSSDPSGYGNAQQQQQQNSQHSSAPMFPSMSVNVSMNMTMGYNVPDHQMPCPQVRKNNENRKLESYLRILRGNDEK